MTTAPAERLLAVGAATPSGYPLTVIDENRNVVRSGYIYDGYELPERPAWAPSGLVFYYLMSDGGVQPSARSVIHRVDLVTGDDAIVFSSDWGSGIARVVTSRVRDDLVFFSMKPRDMEADTQLWSAMVGGTPERIDFEGSYLEAATSEETILIPALAGLRLVEITAADADLVVCRNAAYLVDPTTGTTSKMAFKHAKYAATNPITNEIAVGYQDATNNFAERVARCDADGNYISDIAPGYPLSNPIWSPDGNYVMASSRSGVGLEPQCTAIVELATGRVTLPNGATQPSKPVAFSADSNSVVLALQSNAGTSSATEPLDAPYGRIGSKQSVAAMDQPLFSLVEFELDTLASTTLLDQIVAWSMSTSFA